MGFHRNEMTLEGEVVVLVEKHWGTSAFSHASIDDAYDKWVGGHVQKWSSIDELIREIYDDDEIDTPERKAEVADTIRGRGIKDGQPFLAFNSHSEDVLDTELTEYLPIDTPKEEMVKDVARDDAKRAEIWEAQAGETYGCFIERILKETLCHSLKARELCRALCVTEWDDDEEEEEEV